MSSLVTSDDYTGPVNAIAAVLPGAAVGVQPGPAPSSSSLPGLSPRPRDDILAFSVSPEVWSNNP
jgi:hypothetical protein